MVGADSTLSSLPLSAYWHHPNSSHHPTPTVLKKSKGLVCLMTARDKRAMLGAAAQALMTALGLDIDAGSVPGEKAQS